MSVTVTQLPSHAETSTEIYAAARVDANMPSSIDSPAKFKFKSWDDLTRLQKLACIGPTLCNRQYGKCSAWQPDGSLLDHWNEEILVRIIRILNSKKSRSSISKLFGRHKRRIHPLSPQLFLLSRNGTREDAFPHIVLLHDDISVATRAKAILERDDYVARTGLRCIADWDCLVISAADEHEFIDGVSAGGIKNISRSALPIIACSARQNVSRSGKRGSLGGILKLGRRRYYGLVSAHLFLEDYEDDVKEEDEDKCTESTGSFDSGTDSELRSNAETSASVAAAVGSYDVFLVPRHYSGDSESVTSRSQPLPQKSRHIGRFDGENRDRKMHDNKLDWALVEISDIRLCRQNFIFQNDHSVSLHPGYDSNGPPSGHLLILSGHEGSVSATGRGAKTAIFLPWLSRLVEVWQVTAKTGIGTCGSWVVEPISGAICGIVIAHSPSSKLTFMLPANDVFCDILNAWEGQYESVQQVFQLGIDVRLPGRYEKYNHRTTQNDRIVLPSEVTPRLASPSSSLTPTGKQSDRPPGPDWELTRDRITFRKRVVDDKGDEYWEYWDTGEFQPIPKPTKGTPRSTNTQISTSRTPSLTTPLRGKTFSSPVPSSSFKTSRKPSSTSFSDANTLGSPVKASSLKVGPEPRQEIGSIKQNYEIRERETSRHENRPNNPSQQVLTLISIPGENFSQCRAYLLKHRDLISYDSESEIYSLASDAFESNNLPRFRRCIQRYVLIKECLKRDYTGQEAFLSKLSSEDKPTLQAFVRAYEKAADQFNQTPESRSAPGQDASEYSDLAKKGPSVIASKVSSIAYYHGPSQDEGVRLRQNARHDLFSSSPIYNIASPPSLQKTDSYRSFKESVDEGEARVNTSRSNQARDATHRRTSISDSHHNVHNQEVAMYSSNITPPLTLQSSLPSPTKVSQGPLFQTGAGQSSMSLMQSKHLPSDIVESEEVNTFRSTATPISLKARRSTHFDPRSNVSKDDINTLDSVEPSEIEFRAENQPRGLNSEYKVYHSRQFTVGWVFLIPWVESRYSHAVRMVVVQCKPGAYSHCIRINSHGGTGLRPNLPLAVKRAHAVVYPSHKKPPQGEPELTKDPIAVDLDPGQKLDPASRIHFGKIHTVENNLKVMSVGRIAAKSMPYFTSYFNSENFPLVSKDSD